ncbi:MAG: hypothetical protein LBU32_23650 [Clostridiales bacterium]|jgi:Gpi18-like mannosyltransferase|nr:hypothetical protein [Clostridiales bacterium]
MFEAALLIYALYSSYAVYCSASQKSKKPAYNIAALAITALFIRLLFIEAPGHINDLKLFAEWSRRLYEVGPSGFYQEGYYCDYLPGYLYVLWGIGIIHETFGAGMHLLLKIPGIASDIALGIFIYLGAKKRVDEKTALAAASVALFNPMSIYNSAIWGQMDSLLALFLVISLWLAEEEKYEAAAAVYAVAVAIKPQSVFLAAAFSFIFAKKLRIAPLRWTGRLFFCILAFASTICLIILPFAHTINPVWIAGVYAKTMGEYKFVSLNAYNLWWLLGMNLTSDAGRPWILSYREWGYIGTAVMAFMICCRMHERYIFPAVFFLILAYILSRNPLALLLAALFSALNSVNHPIAKSRGLAIALID